MAAALREAYEELGILPEAVVPLGALPSVNTVVSSMLIFPFVGRLAAPPGFRPRPVRGGGDDRGAASGAARSGDDRSLGVIRSARDAGLVTKSNLILGMGEERAEISQALQDLYDAGCELITITQYLRPTPRHHPVERWVKPHEFVELREEAEEIGFAGVMSGPLVRSSYRAGRLYEQAIAARR